MGVSSWKSKACRKLCAKTLCPPSPESEGSWQMLLLPGVGPGDVKEPEHAEAAAGTVLP